MHINLPFNIQRRKKSSIKVKHFSKLIELCFDRRCHFGLQKGASHSVSSDSKVLLTLYCDLESYSESRIM